MKYKFCDYDITKYATDLRKDSNSSNLMWDNAKGQSVMIIQTSFGENPLDQIDEICDRLEKMTIKENEFNEVFTCVWIRFVTAADKSRFSGCPLNGGASTYTVLSYDMLENVCNIYAPQDPNITSYQCNIPLEVTIKIEEIKSKPFFFSKEQPTGFYEITFPHNMLLAYKEGDLILENGSLQIPINYKMINRRTIYVKADKHPKIISRNKGLKVL